MGLQDERSTPKAAEVQVVRPVFGKHDVKREFPRILESRFRLCIAIVVQSFYDC